MAAQHALQRLVLAALLLSCTTAEADKVRASARRPLPRAAPMAVRRACPPSSSCVRHIVGALGSYFIFDFHLSLTFCIGVGLVIAAVFMYGSSSQTPQELCEQLGGTCSTFIKTTVANATGPGGDAEDKASLMPISEEGHEIGPSPSTASPQPSRGNSPTPENAAK